MAIPSALWPCPHKHEIAGPSLGIISRIDRALNVTPNFQLAVRPKEPTEVQVWAEPTPFEEFAERARQIPPRRPCGQEDRLEDVLPLGLVLGGTSTGVGVPISPPMWAEAMGAL